MKPTIHLLVLLLAGCLPLLAATSKPRVFVLTDIENEPDDAQSMVRFLTYSNQFDVEGLVATTSVHQRDKTAAWRIREIVEAYGLVQANLNLHEPGYPTVEHLRSLIDEGPALYGMDAVGAGHDSSASERLPPPSFSSPSSLAALLAALICSSDALLWVGRSDRW
jgi:hypothetical protein